MSFEPIGTVHSPVVDERDDGWGDVVAEIRLRPELAAGLRGLGDFSHAIVVFHMHRARFDPAADLVRRPRGREDMPPVGIFAQRAKHRPNPIGITAVEIVEVSETSVRVRGLDAIDGTPVLDIKPWVRDFDGVGDARVPEWIERLMQGYF